MVSEKYQYRKNWTRKKYWYRKKSVPKKVPLQEKIGPEKSTGPGTGKILGTVTLWYGMDGMECTFTGGDPGAGWV